MIKLREKKFVFSALLLPSLFMANLSCTRPAPAQADAARPSADDVFKAIEIKDLGLRFELPVTWKSHETDHGTTFYPGPEEATKSFNLLVQGIKKNSDKKPKALSIKEQLISELKAMQKPGELLKTERFEQAGLSGIRLETRFQQDGQDKHKDQILIDNNSYVVSISYNSLARHYPEQIKVWDHLTKSLRAISAGTQAETTNSEATK